MKDFCEAVLILKVKPDVVHVYKTAIETENFPNGLRDHWNGVYARVGIGVTEKHNGDVPLKIELLSHTVKSLKQVVEWYTRVGCTVVRTDYKESKS